MSSTKFDGLIPINGDVHPRVVAAMMRDIKKFDKKEEEEENFFRLLTVYLTLVKLLMNLIRK